MDPAEYFLRDADHRARDLSLHSANGGQRDLHADMLARLAQTVAHIVERLSHLDPGHFSTDGCTQDALDKLNSGAMEGRD